MNWAAWGPTIVAVFTAIFTAGLIAGRIKNQETTIAEHHTRLGEHDEKIGNHAISIAKIEAWKEGYNAGSTRART